MALPLKASPSPSREVILQEAVKGIRYGLFEDEDCLVPLVDENNQPIEVVSDEEGKLDINIETDTPFYLLQTGSTVGYHYDPVIYPTDQDRFILPVYPIEVGVDCSKVESGTFAVYDEEMEVMIMEWSLEDCENPSVMDIGGELEAGKNYVLVQKDLPEWMYGSDIPFSVPMEKQEVSLTVEQMTYGTLEVKLQGLEKKHAFQWQLFEDEACTQAATDTDGKEVMIKGVDDDLFRLKEGSYFLKAINEDMNYLPVEVMEVSVAEKQKTMVELTAVPIRPVVTLLDEKMHPLEGSFDVIDEVGEVIHLQSKQAVQLKRNQTYRIVPVDVPSGYYIPSSILYSTETLDGIIHNVDITARRFTVTLHLNDMQTGEGIGGCEFGVYDENQNLITTVRVSDGRAQINGLSAGKSYRIHQIRTADTWLPVQDQTITIPMEGETEIHVRFTVEGYVHFSAGITSLSNEMIEDGVVALYVDEACTIPASDIRDRKITGGNRIQADVRNGTYYLRMEDVSDIWYLNSETVKVTADHASSSYVTASITTRKIDLSFTVKDDQDTLLSDFTVDLFEKGRKIATLQANGESAAQQGIQLKRNTDYQVKWTAVKGQYVYDSKMQPLKIETMLSLQPQSVQMEAVPYVNLQVLTQQKGTGASYQVYSDPQCTIQAEDVLQENTSAKGIFHLYDGIYWIKTQSIASSWYPHTDPIHVSVDHHRAWNENVIVEHVPVSMMLSSTDSAGQTLDGTMVEIRNLNGELMETAVFTDGMLVLQEGWLRRGESYVVSEIQTPAGYHKCADVQFTVPSSQPSSDPVITIVHEKAKTVTLQKKQQDPVKKQDVIEEKPSEETKTEWYESLKGVIVAAGLFVSLGILLKNITFKKV